MAKNSTRPISPQLILTGFLLVFSSAVAAAPASVSPDLSTPQKIAAFVYALADFHQEPLHIFGLSPERPSRAEAVTRGEPFKADCVVFAKTARDLLERAGYEARMVSVKLPPTGPCTRQFDGAGIVCSYAHAVAVYRDRGGQEIALDIRQPRPVPFDALIRNSRYTVEGDAEKR